MPNYGRQPAIFPKGLIQFQICEAPLYEEAIRKFEELDSKYIGEYVIKDYYTDGEVYAGFRTVWAERTLDHYNEFWKILDEVREAHRTIRYYVAKGNYGPIHVAEMNSYDFIKCGHYGRITYATKEEAFAIVNEIAELKEDIVDAVIARELGDIQKLVVKATKISERISAPIATAIQNTKECQ